MESNHRETTTHAACLSSTYSVSDLDVGQATQRLWTALQAADGHLPDLSQPGCGEIAGGHLRVRYVSDSDARLFGCEVIDLRGGSIWEAGIARTPHGGVTFWRCLAGSPMPPAPWQAAVEGAHLAPQHPRHEPAFLSLVGAYFGSDGFALAENISNRAALDDDLAYWRELARSQARLIEQHAQQARPVHHIPGPVEEEEPVAQTRAWELKDIGEWASLNQDRIIILPRAQNAARKSDYFEPATVFAALDVLANEYAGTKKGLVQRDAAKLKFDALNIEMGGSIDPGRAGAAGDAYFIQWRGRRRFLDQHLKKGISRESRFTLRIYFTWDDELRIPIVGWLPSHLDNSKT